MNKEAIERTRKRLKSIETQNSLTKEEMYLIGYMAFMPIAAIVILIIAVICWWLS